MRMYSSRSTNGTLERESVGASERPGAHASTLPRSHAPTLLRSHAPTLPRSHARLQGNTLAATLCATVIVGLALICYLRLATNQNQLIVRSQVWNNCMPVVEAGVEEALAHLSANYATNMVSNGWLQSGQNYSLTNSVDNGYYEVNITTNLPYTVVATGYSPMPSKSLYVSRKIQVTTQNKGMFLGALVVRSQ